MRRRPRDWKRSCRTCNIDITDHVRYTRWTQCSLCYWKDRLEHCKPLPELQKELNQTRTRGECLPSEILDTNEKIAKRRADLRGQQKWWQKLLGDPKDEHISELTRRYYALQTEQDKCKSRIGQLIVSIENYKKTKKRYIQAQMARVEFEQQQQKKTIEIATFNEKCASQLNSEFERTLYQIQPKDYRRGNTIDNYIRNHFAVSVLNAFNHACTFCKCSDDLTFDHYGLTKNEGGNFILIAKDKSAIKVNLVVLCRGCNSMKAQQTYSTFFDDNMRNELKKYQEHLLALVLADTTVMKLIDKWAKFPI